MVWTWTWCTCCVSASSRGFCKGYWISLWSSDILLGHFLLFMLAIPLLVPYIDRIHATGLFWLRPSRQIRTPFYLLEQKRQRRRIVIAYGIILLFILALFVASIVIRGFSPGYSYYYFFFLFRFDAYLLSSALFLSFIGHFSGMYITVTIWWTTESTNICIHTRCRCYRR